MEKDTWLLLFLSLALGLLVGLQRESTNSKTAGIRTFPLITLTGTLCGLLALEYGVWILAAGMISVCAVLIMTNIYRMKNEVEGSGMTTEIAVLLMFVLGAYLVEGKTAVAVVLTGVVTVLLHFKTTLHGWVARIGDTDLKAVMQFVLISMVILPVLPNEPLDPYESLNPRNIWLMVVLIVGISLAGYFFYKISSNTSGALMGGVLGGLISSTATTLSYAKTAGRSEAAGKLAAFVILTASAVSLIRVMVEISVVAPSSVKYFLLPLGAELLLMIILVGFLYFSHRKEKSEMPKQDNPAQLKGAIIFALLYGAISFISAAVRDKFGESGLYVVSIISGLTDLDAITLSTAKMTEQDSIKPALGWRLILVAAMANLVFKAGLAVIVGNRVLIKQIVFLFGILIAAGIAILLIWPD